MFSSLSIGASALFAAQRALETASNNVANANTEGYTRQRVEIQAATPTPGTPGLRGDGMRGTGVTIVDISRLRDALSDVAWRNEASYAGSAAARSGVLDRTQQILGPFSAGAPDSLSKFWAAWDQLSLTPTDPAARAGVINAGNEIAQALNDASKNLDNVTADASLKVADDVTEVNNLASQIAKLNRGILDATTSGSAPNDLLDARDKALDRLSTLTGATVHVEDNGMADVFLGSQSLVRGTDTYALTSGATGGLPTVAFADGSPAPLSGELGGLLAVTNQTIPSMRADLDAIATGLRDVVNTAHAQGFDLNGNPGGDFFTGSSAADIQVTPGMTPDQIAASASGSPNDGNNALSMAQLRNAPGVGTSTVGDALRALAGRLGAEAASAAQNSSASQTSLTSLQTTRASNDGVNIDEEMVDLVKFQHSYEAAAKVISISDSMLDTLINGMGIGR